MMIHEFWLFLLPVAAISSWLIATHHSSDKPKKKQEQVPVSRDYLVGLNFLLNEEPDKALDIFMRMVEVDSEAIETHLALGNLFRRRGEVERAIRIHQNLMARPTLSKEERAQALYALATDYLSSGLFDRAEQLFRELVSSKQFVASSLQHLLSIYEQSKEWEKAIGVARKLSLHSNSDRMSMVIGHYYCELAELQIARSSPREAIKLLKKALSSDKRCARASLLWAQVEMSSGHYAAAIRHLKRVKTQNSDVFSEAIFSLVEAYQALKKEKELAYYFKDILREFPKLPIAIMLSEQVRQWRGDKAAANYVADYVRKHPSVYGLHHLVELHLPLTEGKAKEDLTILHGLTKKLLSEHPPYRCSNCGFACQKMNWQCPRCKLWGKVKPSYVLD